MSFRLVEKKVFSSTDVIPEGYVSIDRGGNARFHAEDLQLVGIEGVAIVLVDEMTLRIGIRKPRSGEQQNAYMVRPVYKGKKPDRSRLQISLRSALNELRLEAKAVAGRYQLMSKGDLLTINLAGIEEKEATENAKDEAADEE